MVSSLNKGSIITVLLAYLLTFLNKEDFSGRLETAMLAKTIHTVGLPSLDFFYTCIITAPTKLIGKLECVVQIHKGNYLKVTNFSGFPMLNWLVGFFNW